MLKVNLIAVSFLRSCVLSIICHTSKKVCILLIFKDHVTSLDIYLFALILVGQVNSFSVMSGWVFLCGTSTKQGSVCLAQGHNAVTPVRLEPAAPLFRVKHSTTEPLHSYLI